MKTENNKFNSTEDRNFKNSDSQITDEATENLNNNPYDSENLDNESDSELKDITEQDIENDLKNNDLFESDINLEIDNQDRKLGSNELDDSELHRKEFEIGELSNEQIQNDEFIRDETNHDKFRKNEFDSDLDIEEEDPKSNKNKKDR
ncbi:hypothetical protein NJT12_10040 [Flavobacterium sp. AC]|uniref:Uncharacterized protein n=1 Tax=Flavobacterium azizsancarii TaxID=2961580 RepID=A0ABT4WBV8_9FLAO|nr:hypothetical protein [Flavobacterium azizsancarii]MDA6069956.1 hypothetical protein [Flavobacterium azizsancarii]